MKKLTPEILVDLALEFDLTDSIDWGLLPLKEEEIYYEMAENVVEFLSNSKHPELVAAAALTKLLVENFVLNLQLSGYFENNT